MSTLLNISSSLSGCVWLRSHQPEALNELVIAWMRRYPLAPLETECMVVQSHAMSQSMRRLMAEPQGLGIAAGLDFVFPLQFIWRAYRMVLGQARVPFHSAYDVGVLPWRCRRVLEQHVDELSPLWRYVNQGSKAAREERLQALCHQLALLFDQYQVYRADWLNYWEQGKNILSAHQEVPLAYQWQCALWRYLLEDVEQTEPQWKRSSRSHIHQEYMQVVKNLEHRPVGLPRRIWVVGVSNLPSQAVEALMALSSWCQVLLTWHTPSQHDLCSQEPQQALLKAWGKQNIDFSRLLSLYPAQEVDHFFPPSRDTLLHCLQHDIFENQATEPESIKEYLKDGSIQFHVCHGRQREVEVLHDQVIEALQKDPSLKPSDVMVMVSDIEAYAPIIHSVWGRLETFDSRYVPYSVADVASVEVQALQKALSLLLSLPLSRWKPSQWLELLQVPAVGRRFGFDEEDLLTLQAWWKEACVVWGIDAAHREALGVWSVPQEWPSNEKEMQTWSWGIRRLLLGYAMGNEPLSWQSMEPALGISGLKGDLAGRFLEWLDEMLQTTTHLQAEKKASQWVPILSALLDRFFEPRTEKEIEAWEHWKASLLSWHENVQAAQYEGLLSVELIKKEWWQAMQQKGLQTRFLSGGVTFASLLPMRGLPFKRIYILGLLEGEFPRNPTPSDFDLMGLPFAFRFGDRSRRDDDYALFLDAFLCAREAFILFWSGKKSKDDSPQWPSVVVLQLLEALRGEAETKSDMLDYQEHRRHAFHVDYFKNSEKWFTYVHEWQSHRPVLKLNEKKEKAPLASGAINIEEFIKGLLKPVPYYMKKQWGVQWKKTIEEQEPLQWSQASGLTQWQVKKALISDWEQWSNQEDDFDDFLSRWSQRLRQSGYWSYGPPSFQREKEWQKNIKAWMGPWVAYQKQMQRMSVSLSDDPLIRFYDEKSEIDLQMQSPVFYRNKEGRLLRLRLLEGKLEATQNRKIGNEWIQHVMLNACGYECDTYLWGNDKKSGMLEAMPIEQAKDHMALLWQAWLLLQTAPMPWPFATLQATKREIDFLNHQKAKKVYEGDAYVLGEKEQDLEWKRWFPSYESLCDHEAFLWGAHHLWTALKIKALDVENSLGANEKDSEK